jgi:hypothetical protein
MCNGTLSILHASLAGFKMTDDNESIFATASEFFCVLISDGSCCVVHVLSELDFRFPVGAPLHGMKAFLTTNQLNVRAPHPKPPFHCPM